MEIGCYLPQSLHLKRIAFLEETDSSCEAAWEAYLVIMKIYIHLKGGFRGGSDSKESACNKETRVWYPGQGRSPGRRKWKPIPILAWRIPWIDEPGGLQFMGSQESDTTNTFVLNKRIILTWFSEFSHVFCFLKITNSELILTPMRHI